MGRRGGFRGSRGGGGVYHSGGGGGGESLPIAGDAEMMNYTGDWRTSMFGLSNCGICCEAWTCYYCLHGYIYHELAYHGGDNGDLDPECCNQGCALTCMMDSVAYCLGIIFTNQSRLAVRTRYKIKENSCGGCCAQCMCPPCAAAQLAQELDSHGDWNGSMCSSKSSQPRETTNETAPLSQTQLILQGMTAAAQQAQMQQVQMQQGGIQQQQGIPMAGQPGMMMNVPPQPGIMMQPQPGMMMQQPQAQQQPGMMMQQQPMPAPAFTTDPYQQQQQQPSGMPPGYGGLPPGFAAPPPPPTMS